jgi:hypothetical protein
VAHDLRDGHCGKGARGLQAYREHRGEHLDAPSRVQTMPLSWHCTTRADGCEPCPEPCHQMMLRPQVPECCTAHRDVAHVHQRRAARGTRVNKAACDGTTRGTMTLDSTRRHVNAPGGIMQHQRFFPRRGVRLFPIHGQGVMAFACHDDGGTPAPRASVSARC